MIYIYTWYIYIYIYDMTHTHTYIYTNSQNVIITAQMPTNGLNRHPSCPRWLMATSRWCSRPRSDAQRSASATALTSRGIASCWKSSCSQRKRQGIAGIWMGYGWDSGCDMFFHVFPGFNMIQHDSTRLSMFGFGSPFGGVWLPMIFRLGLLFARSNRWGCGTLKKASHPVTSYFIDFIGC